MVVCQDSNSAVERDMFRNVGTSIQHRTAVWALGSVSSGGTRVSTGQCVHQCGLAKNFETQQERELLFLFMINWKPSPNSQKRILIKLEGKSWHCRNRLSSGIKLKLLPKCMELQG